MLKMSAFVTTVFFPYLYYFPIFAEPANELFPFAGVGKKKSFQTPSLKDDLKYHLDVDFFFFFF